MTDKQREQIRKLRYEGAGYKAIATELDLSLNTVKSYCRRNLLQGAGSVAAINNLVSVEKGLVCKNCGKQLRHTEGKRKRVFCSDSCRKKHWKQKKELDTMHARIAHLRRFLKTEVPIFQNHGSIMKCMKLRFVVSQ